MLRSLVEFSLRFRGVVVALACVVVGYGIYTTFHAKFDVYPEFAPPRLRSRRKLRGCRRKRSRNW